MSDYTPTFNEQKTTEAASILLRMEGGQMSYMKLIKLLYIIDRIALKQWEHPITYDRYYSMREGQVLSTVLDMVKNHIIGDYWHKHIENCGRYTVELSEPVEIRKLSPAEVRLIESVYSDLGKYDQFQLGDITKRGAEYQKTEKRILTPLDNLLSALHYDDDDIKRIKETFEEEAYLDAIFEV